MPPKAKPSGQRLIVKLKVPADILLRFSTEETKIETVPDKSGSSSSSTPAPAPVSSSTPDIPSDANSTPVPSVAPSVLSGALPVNPLKRKGIPGPKPGTKRGPVLGPDGLPKPRGKPGPKKKPRLEDGTIDHGEAGPPNRNTGATTSAAHKLGPKANQGAINAGLRALDRTGKPCRKWEKKSFRLKSFTGVIWEIPTWRAPKPAKEFSGTESQENSNPSIGNTNSEGKGNKEASENSNADAEVPASSPAALVATPA